MQELVRRGRTSNIFHLFLPDSTSAVGAGKTALTNTSTGLNIAVRRELVATVTAYTAAGNNVETITTLGTYQAPSSGKCRFKEVDATNMPGIYEIHLLNSVLDASDASRFLVGMVQATGIAPTPFRIPLTSLDLEYTEGTVVSDAGNTAQTFKISLTAAATDSLKNAYLRFMSGNLAGQVQRITAFNGTTDFVTMAAAFTEAPAANDRFVIVDR
jgi:hypothetical protein